MPAPFDSFDDRDLLSRKLPSEANPETPFWTRRKVKWLVATPLALGLLWIAFGKQLRSEVNKALAIWHSDRAAECLAEDDIQGALEHANAAIEWLPGETQLYRLRAEVYTQSFEIEDYLQKSLADYNRVLEEAPKSTLALRGRAMVYQRLGRCREAIDDLNKQVELAPSGDPFPLNDRAYVRALCQMELDEAQSDIEKAINLAGESNGAMLDTRAYIYYLQDKSSQAMEDIARAIELEEQQAEQFFGHHEFAQLPAGQQARWHRRFNENLAVMFHHRGLIHEKLGNNENAEADFAKAKQLGYNPAHGVQ